MAISASSRNAGGAAGGRPIRRRRYAPITSAARIVPTSTSDAGNDNGATGGDGPRYASGIGPPAAGARGGTVSMAGWSPAVAAVSIMAEISAVGWISPGPGQALYRGMGRDPARAI